MTRLAKVSSRLLAAAAITLVLGGCSPSDSVHPGEDDSPDAVSIVLSVSGSPESYGFVEFQKVTLVASVLDPSGASIDRDEVRWDTRITEDLVILGPRKAELTLGDGANIVTAYFYDREGRRLESSLSIQAQSAAKSMVLWQPDGSVREIPVPAGLGSIVPRAINERGQVAGSLNTGSQNRAFFWSDSTGFRLIGGIGEDYSESVDLNDEGLVTGSLRLGDRFKGFVWSLPAGVSVIDDTMTTVFVGINNSRQIAAITGFRAMRGTAEGGFLQLAIAPEEQCSGASAISNAGFVIGWIGARFENDSCVDWSPVIWDPDGTAHKIYECTKSVTCAVQAIDVNTWGEVAGNRNGRPFRWTKAEGFREILGDAGGFVAAINDRGEIVGMLKYGTFIPVLWRADNSMRILSLPPGKKVATPYALNNQGQVVGVTR